MLNAEDLLWADKLFAHDVLICRHPDYWQQRKGEQQALDHVKDLREEEDYSVRRGHSYACTSTLDGCVMEINGGFISQRGGCSDLCGEIKSVGRLESDGHEHRWDERNEASGHHASPRLDLREAGGTRRQEFNILG